MISGIGESGDWNGYHFKSPSVLDVGDFLLVAYEGWEAPRVSSGIGLMIGIERWIRGEDRYALLNFENGFSSSLTIGNYGAGRLTIFTIEVSDPSFRLQIPPLPLELESSEELSIPVEFTPGPPDHTIAGTVTVRSDSMIDPDLNLYVIAY